mmetsp:Transcript_76045/g.215031  ORF Transcript_76045/g.215031 Transcript_76045/m.215031 type:complete len:290 (-) Transcript_76045:405-1274(-)
MLAGTRRAPSAQEATAAGLASQQTKRSSAGARATTRRKTSWSTAPSRKQQLAQQKAVIARIAELGPPDAWTRAQIKEMWEDVVLWGKVGGLKALPAPFQDIHNLDSPTALLRLKVTAKVNAAKRARDDAGKSESEKSEPKPDDGAAKPEAAAADEAAAGRAEPKTLPGDSSKDDKDDEGAAKGQAEAAAEAEERELVLQQLDRQAKEMIYVVMECPYVKDFLVAKQWDVKSRVLATLQDPEDRKAAQDTSVREIRIVTQPQEPQEGAVQEGAVDAGPRENTTTIEEVEE